MNVEYLLIYVDELGNDHMLAMSEDRREVDNLKMEIERLRPPYQKVTLEVTDCQEIEAAEEA